jgi:hypothetical protein
MWCCGTATIAQLRAALALSAVTAGALSQDPASLSAANFTVAASSAAPLRVSVRGSAELDFEPCRAVHTDTTSACELTRSCGHLPRGAEVNMTLRVGTRTHPTRPLLLQRFSFTPNGAGDFVTVRWGAVPAHNVGSAPHLGTMPWPSAIAAPNDAALQPLMLRAGHGGLAAATAVVLVGGAPSVNITANQTDQLFSVVVDMQCEAEFFFVTAIAANLSLALGELAAALQQPSSANGYEATWRACCASDPPPTHPPKPLPVPLPAPPPPPPVPVATAPPCEQPQFAQAAYCNQSLSATQRARKLLAAMTLDEKMGVIQNVNVGVPRLGVLPLSFGEALHGACPNVRGAQVGNSTGWSTSFPSPIGLGATFDPQLFREIGAVIGREGRSLHNQNARNAIFFWAPVINLCRDARWGRCQETPGAKTDKFHAVYIQPP